jgi:YD repeat-containing protein
MTSGSRAVHLSARGFASVSCVLGNHAAQGTIGYAYDWVGNLTNIDYPASVDVRLQYDAHQRLTNLVDAVGTSVFGYWPGGQLRFEDGPWASDTLTNTYTRGRRTALLLQQPAGSWTNAFGYDTAGRLTNVTSPAGVFGYLYPASGVRHQVSRLLLPSGAYITNDFDSVGRLLFTKLHTSGAVVTNSHSYDYNIASQRLRGTLGEGSSYSYSYDPIGQLSHARFTNALGQSVSGLGRDYAYDAAWNLAWRTNGGAAQQFVVNPKNELTNSTPTVAQTYDANGNLLTREQGQWTYSYDDANQLRWLVKSNASLPEAWTELVYDGLGRLRVRREYAWIGYVEPDDPDLNAAMTQTVKERCFFQVHPWTSWQKWLALWKCWNRAQPVPAC